MKKNFSKKILFSVLTLAMALGGSGVAMAAEGQQTGTAATETQAESAATSSLPQFDNSNVYTSDITTSKGTGYYSVGGVYISIPFVNSTTDDINVYIYRAVGKGGKFTQISSTAYSGYSSGVYYYDYSVEMGQTYYYKAVVKKSGSSAKVKSGVVKYQCGKISTDLSVTLTDDGAVLTMSNYSIANRFDIYRSTKPGSGFKKIKTVYEPEYTDKTVKSGKTYYYKVIPKCYVSDTGKTYTGEKTDAYGIKVSMADAYDMDLTLSEASSTAIKAEWTAVTGANCYEVWYKCTSISGDKYYRAGKTTKTSYTIKGLTKGETYDVMVKAQSRSKGIVSAENTTNTQITLGGLDIRSLAKVSVATSLSKDKKTLAIYTRYKWSRCYGATGYVITAYNNYTGKTETIKRIKSSSTTTYRFRNVATSSKGIKYSSVQICAYKGKETGSTQSLSTATLPYAQNVKAVKKSGDSVKITWKAVPGASGYTVYHNSAFASGDYVTTTSTTYCIDSNVTTKTKYTYYVCPNSSFSGVSSPYSYDDEDVTVSNTYVHKLSTPKITSVKNTASGAATVTWETVAKAKYYIVYRATSKNGTYKRVGVTKGDLTYTDKKLTKGKKYYYKVVAKTVSDGGVASKSAASSAVGVKISK